MTQFHNSATRDGRYVDAAFTKTAAAMIHKDMSFTAATNGNMFAQPLYFEGAAGGKNLIITATLSNQVTAFDASNGAMVWRKQIGTAAPASQFIGGDGAMPTLGIVGTPVIDAASKTLFFDAAETGPVRRIHALSLDDGAEKAGWPVDSSMAGRSGGVTFDPRLHSQRAAPIIVGGRLYMPYGGIIGDAGAYKGWVIGIQIDNPAMTGAYATTAPRGAGIWGPGGLTSDGTSIFAVTGNSMTAAGGFNAPPTWGQGEAVLKLSAGPAFSNMPADYFRPSNWVALDNSDTDLGGSGAILVDVPGATPSQLLVALGKNGVVYLLNRANLGGQGTGNGTTGEGVVSLRAASNSIIQAGAAYRTAMGTYVVFKGNGVGCPMGMNGDLVAVKITAASPPTLSVAWCANVGGNGSPMVTMTDDAGANAIVWRAGTNNLRGFDGDTGAPVFMGNDMVPGMAKFISPIAARGRIFIGTNSGVTAFTLTP